MKTMTSDEAFKAASEKCPTHEIMDSDLWNIWNAALEWAKSGQEPVLYQGRMQPMCTDRQTWTAWSECTKGTYEDYKRVPENGDWRFESRALYTHPALAQPAEEAQPLVCERCEELGYDKATYFRLYEQACIELQQIKKQEFVVELEISCTEIEGERIEVLSCDLPAGTHKLYTQPAPAQPVRLSDDEIRSVWEPLQDALCLDHKVFANAIQDAMLAKGAAQPAEAPVLDLKHIAYDALCEAAGKSKWIPKEYWANDWLADCRDFLINGHEQPAVVQQLIEAAEEAENCLYSFYAGPEWASEDFATLQKLQDALKAVKGE